MSASELEILGEDIVNVEGMIQNKIVNCIYEIDKIEIYINMRYLEEI